MRCFVFVVALSGALSFTPLSAKLVAPLGVRRVPPPLLAETAAVSEVDSEETAAASKVDSKEANIFTMQENDDGWDDVRTSIRKAKTDRSKALEQIQTKYGPPLKTAVKWAKVLGSEVAGSAPTDISLPKVSIPKVSDLKISVPKASDLKVSVPKVSVPKISLPKVSLPQDAVKSQDRALFSTTTVPSSKKMPLKKFKKKDAAAVRGFLPAVGVLGAPFALAPVIILAAVLRNPGILPDQLPFNFLDDFYPPAVERKVQVQERAAKIAAAEKAAKETERLKAEEKARMKAEEAAEQKAAEQKNRVPP